MIDAKLIETFRILSEKTEGNKRIVAALMTKGPEAMKAYAEAHAVSVLSRIKEAKKRLAESVHA